MRGVSRVRIGRYVIRAIPIAFGSIEGDFHCALEIFFDARFLSISAPFRRRRAHEVRTKLLFAAPPTLSCHV
jgi:hypothetical protein